MPYAAGEVTVGLASHWPRLQVYRLFGIKTVRRGDDHPAAYSNIMDGLMAHLSTLPLLW